VPEHKVEAGGFDGGAIFRGLLRGLAALGDGEAKA